MSRRINNADGSFGGVVSLAFQADYFADVYDKVTIEPMTFYLFGQDGMIRSTSADSTAMLGKSLAGGHVLRAMTTELTHGGLIAEGFFRNARRFISYRQISEYPLIIEVAIDENVALERHRMRRNIYFGITFLVSMMLTVMLVGLHQSLKKQEKLRLSIWAEKEKAETYLDMAGSLIVARDKEARITLINHKGCEILGYGEEELLGKDWIEVVVPQEQRSLALSHFQQLLEEPCLRLLTPLMCR
ncbi:MAG: PAS domain S-box protein [Negativicutes bacterium]